MPIPTRVRDFSWQQTYDRFQSNIGEVTLVLDVDDEVCSALIQLAVRRHEENRWGPPAAFDLIAALGELERDEPPPKRTDFKDWNHA